MAFTNFYISSGSDLNAGSTSSDAGGSNSASLTYAAGTFVRATGVFTVASGNPSSDGVSVGQWVSIYTTSGAVAATFIGQCTARDATTITVSITVKLGLTTAVSEGAGATTAKVGGAWASELVLAATGLGTCTVAASTKVNIKQATYTVVANRTISMAGSTTAPLWFSGYNTTPGDLDNDTTNALSKPVFAVDATFVITTSGVHQTWSGLSVTGDRSGVLWSTTVTPGQMIRMRINNVSSNTAAVAIQTAGAGCFAYCWFKTPTTATTTGTVNASANDNVFCGCVAEGGGLAGFNAANTRSFFQSCISLNNTGSGILISTGNPRILGCTVYNATGDGIKWTGTPGALSCVIGTLLSNCGGYGINNGSGTNTNMVMRACNDFYLCTAGNVNGFGDSPAFFGQTESNPVVTSATDMTPVVGSAARAQGFPGVFENQSYSSYPDIGAVEHIDPAAGGGLLRHPGMASGLNG